MPSGKMSKELLTSTNLVKSKESAKRVPKKSKWETVWWTWRNPNSLRKLDSDLPDTCTRLTGHSMAKDSCPKKESRSCQRTAMLPTTTPNKSSATSSNSQTHSPLTLSNFTPDSKTGHWSVPSSQEWSSQKFTSSTKSLSSSPNPANKPSEYSETTSLSITNSLRKSLMKSRKMSIKLLLTLISWKATSQMWLLLFIPEERPLLFWRTRKTHWEKCTRKASLMIFNTKLWERKLMLIWSTFTSLHWSLRNWESMRF